jgi:hypothetical protein
MTIYYVFRSSLAKIDFLHRLPFVPKLPACLEAGGVGRGHMWGRLALLLLASLLGATMRICHTLGILAIAC